MNPCRHCIQSQAFAARFSKIREIDLFKSIASYCNEKGGGPLGGNQLILMDDNGEEHLFEFETFFIKYKPPAKGDALTLGRYIQPYARSVAVSF